MIILERRQKPSSFILPNICKEHSGPGGLAVQLAAGWCARRARLTGDRGVWRGATEQSRRALRLLEET